jgi:hypothetical protein
LTRVGSLSMGTVWGSSVGKTMARDFRVPRRSGWPSREAHPASTATSVISERRPWTAAVGSSTPGLSPRPWRRVAVRGSGSTRPARTAKAETSKAAPTSQTWSSHWCDEESCEGSASLEPPELWDLLHTPAASYTAAAAGTAEPQALGNLGANGRLSRTRPGRSGARRCP